MLKKLKTLVIGLFATVLIAGCSLPGLGGTTSGKNITIAAQSSTEGEILTYILEGMMEHYIDTDVSVIDNLGSSTVTHQAIEIGDANARSVGYTGTSLTGELGMEAITDSQAALEQVVKAFDEQFNQNWYPTYGFANTYAFMVTRETAEEYGLEKVSDLEPYAAEFDVGVDSTWINREGDGYDAFTEVYDFEFPNLLPMSIGLVYTAVANDEVDVVLGYSTDGRIIAEDLVVLEDDLQLFPPYDASPIATQELVEAVPAVEDVMLKLANTISDEEMQTLNYTSDNYLLEPRTVAYDWLEENNYFEDKEPYLEPIQREQEGGDN